MPKAIPTPPPAAVTPDAAVVNAPRPIPMETASVPVPMPPVETQASTAPKVESPMALPSLPSMVEGKRPPSILPLDKPVGTSATPPNPTPLDPAPVVTEAPVVLPETPAAGLPVPSLPTFEIPKRVASGGKPEDAAGAAPKPTTVTSPTPLILPPLPLDPVDAGVGAEK
jgi:hypothetical protein